MSMFLAMIWVISTIGMDEVYPNVHRPILFSNNRVIDEDGGIQKLGNL